MTRAAFKTSSEYIDTGRGYSGIQLFDAIASCGNPLIGHRFKEKHSRILNDTVYGKREDIYFEEFMKGFLEQSAGNLVYDIPPLKWVYSNLLRMESQASIGTEMAESKLDLGKRDLTYVEADIEDLRMGKLQAQYRHLTVGNARKLLENKFPYLPGSVSENQF